MEEDSIFDMSECCTSDAVCGQAMPEPVADPFWQPNMLQPSYERETYPWERTMSNGAVYIRNERFLLDEYDAAGFRLTENMNIEFLVRDEDTGKLKWVPVEDMPPVKKTS